MKPRRWISAVMLLALCLVASTAWAGRNAFIDPATGVLKAHGFVERNQVGDVRVPVADDFALEPERWRWTGSAWTLEAQRPTRQVDLLRSAARDHVNAVLADPAIPRRVRDALRAIMDLFE